MKFVITFQAIQNFIPDGEGRQIPNTITNSLKIFNAFDTDDLEITDLSLFVIENVSGNVTIKAKTGVTYPETLVLPQTDASGNTITHIDSSFANLSGVKNLVIPSGYTTIAAGAFAASSIENVDMSDSSITEIPESVFQYTYSLESVTLPEGVVNLGKYSFYGSSIKSINLPSTLKRIELGSLWNTSLVSLYIPASVEYIDENGIRSTKMIEIIVDEENNYYYDDDDMVLYSYNNALLFLLPNYPNSTFEIPEGITKLSFYSLSLASKVTNVKIPSSLTTIAEGVFSSSVETLEISENNTSFYTSEDGKSLISSSHNLIKCFVKDYSDFVIPDYITDISRGCFANCKINTLTIGKSVAKVNSLSFSTLYVNYIEIHEENSYFFLDNDVALISNSGTLYKYASGSTLESYTIPSSVKTIESYAFYYINNIVSITISDGVTTCQYSAFIECRKLKNVTMTSSMEHLYNSFCYNSAIEEITVYGSLHIDALSNNPSLKKIILGETVTSISYNCFRNLPVLETLVFVSTTPPTLDNINIFTGTTSSTYKIYVPDEALETYKTADGFSYFANKIYPVSELSA